MNNDSLTRIMEHKVIKEILAEMCMPGQSENVQVYASRINAALLNEDLRLEQLMKEPVVSITQRYGAHPDVIYAEGKRQKNGTTEYYFAAPPSNQEMIDAALKEAEIKCEEVIRQYGSDSPESFALRKAQRKIHNLKGQPLKDTEEV